MGSLPIEILPEIDLNQKKEMILADLPFWKTIEEVDPNLAFRDRPASPNALLPPVESDSPGPMGV